jgi:c-di-GMP-binding flagellar brake protein YcgR
MEENRKFKRLPDKIVVKYEKITFPIIGSGQKAEAKATNISLGGICIYSKEVLKQKDVINLEIIIKDYYKYSTSYKYTDNITDYSFNVIGKVRYQNRKMNGKYETGIQFTNIDIDDVMGIKKYLKEMEGEK